MSQGSRSVARPGCACAEGPGEDDEDLTPSASDHIYAIDGPGLSSKSITGGPYTVMTANLREWVMVRIYGVWYQCSGFFKWHSQDWERPKNTTELTRDSRDRQKLGDGWIAVPASPN
ncbi:MAG: hypothetical protein ACE5R4_17210 [Armatimonadota bacterium]